MMPGWAPVRPSYMCRSDPQMAVEVIRITTSVGFRILASSTSSTATLNGSWYTTAFTKYSPNPLFPRAEALLVAGSTPCLRSIWLALSCVIAGGERSPVLDRRLETSFPQGSPSAISSASRVRLYCIKCPNPAQRFYAHENLRGTLLEFVNETAFAWETIRLECSRESKGTNYC